MYAPSVPTPVPEVQPQAKKRIEQVQAFVASMRQYAVLAAVALVATLLLVASPAHATSFSIDMASMMSSAADIFNGLWPAFAIVVGLGLGVQILRFIVNAVRAAF